MTSRSSHPVLYYGPFVRYDYQLWTPDRVPISFKDAGLSAEVTQRIDGGFCPGSTMLGGHLNLAPFEDQIEGVWRSYQCVGWTVLATWCRRIDPRPYGHATFLVRGCWIGDASVLSALELVQRSFPTLWERLPEEFLVLP